MMMDSLHMQMYSVMLEMYNDKKVEDNEINIANTMPYLNDS